MSVGTVPTPNLGVEKYVQLKAVAKARGGRFDLQASYGYTHVDGGIMVTPKGELGGGLPVVTKSDSGDGFVSSVDLLGRVSLADPVSFFGAASWMEGSVDEVVLPQGNKVRSPITPSTPPFAQLGPRVEPGPKGLHLEAQARGALRQDKLSLRDKTDVFRIPPRGTPGYLVFDLRAGAEVLRDAEISLALENLTDETCRIHGSGIHEPGFHFVLGLPVRF